MKKRHAFRGREMWSAQLFDLAAHRPLTAASTRKIQQELSCNPPVLKDMLLVRKVVM